MKNKRFVDSALFGKIFWILYFVFLFTGAYIVCLLMSGYFIGYLVGSGK